MFESEDWNFDEEFLQDADDKALKFFSQVENEEVELPVKKRKLNECQNSDILTNKILSEQQNVTSNNKESTSKVDTSNSSRKNFVLGIFQQNSQKKDDSKIEYKSQNRDNVLEKPYFKNISQNNVTSQRLNGPKLENDSSLQASRKNVVLDILKRKNVQNITDNSSKLSSSISAIASFHSEKPKGMTDEKNEVSHNTTLQKSNSYPQSKHKSPFFHKNETFNSNASSKIENCNQKVPANEDLHQRSPEESVKEVSRNLEQAIKKNASDNKQDIFKESRKLLLMQHLKPSTSFDNGFIKKTKHVSFTSKTEKQSNKRTTLVRKFPGPAGLLPDIIDNSVLQMSHVTNLEDSKSNSIQDQKDTSLTEYCSQDTKTLFSEGAWQMMMDDLPPEFLKNYEIAEIKEIASENHQQCTKIPFLAGIIESIDYSHENPPIVLKDFTDRIEGIIHADIPLKYPGALDRNVVILLQNVGLLCISGTFVIHKYHILISPSNLLAIYSHKGDIIRTPQMKLLKKEFCMIEPSSMNLNTQQNDKCNMHQNNINGSSKKNHCSRTFESLDEPYNSDIDSDSLLFTVDLKEITDSQNQKNFIYPRLPTEDTTIKEDKENIHSNEMSSLQASTNTPAKCLKDLELNYSDKTDNSTKNKNISIKSRLSAFKCKDILTPMESNSESINTKSVLQDSENKSADKEPPSEMHWAEDILHNSDDSDDEMLSQLDVDNIL
ncbi:hypothetical protein KPH14_008406 [Odynerus spinipes]|uniref:Homologous recombination OB-fold protein OB-fold domain-containing protein n=1 Tax=Odynerus spinipes TaxID=1348599 RepID=A0AAD9RBW9_9HYME|nr:hypothetical protein KPH14_008406 [Odynerus spinipes]